MSGNTLFYKKPARYWTQALPMGNGTMGAMFFSGTRKDRIALNNDTLWSGHPKSFKRDGAYESYERARELAVNGRYHEAQEELKANFLGCWSQAYMPLCDLFLSFKRGVVRSYARTLDLSNSVLVSSYESKGIKYTKTAFVSHPHDVTVYRIEAEGGSLEFALSAECKLKSDIYIKDGVLIIDGECPSNAENHLPKKVEYSDKEDEKGIEFRAAAKIVTDGEVKADGNALKVKKASAATVYFTSETSFNGFAKFPATDGKAYKQPCLDKLNAAADAGYETVKAEHIKDYKSYYDRVKLDLGSNKNETVTTDKRLLKFKKEQNDPSLYTLIFNFGRYLLIAGSRAGSQALNLQGIWNEHLVAPWNSNYTVNINTEMNYWPVLMCNMPELMEPLVDLIKGISVTGETTAREFYHAKGFVAHHNVDLWRHTVPVLGETQWAFWQGGSGWLCRSLYEMYEYTLDKAFLRDTAYPLMKKAAEFYLDILYKDEDGSLSIVPGTSPENTFFTDGKKVTSVAKNSAMMNSIALDLLINCKKSCEALGVDDDFYKNVCSAIGKIPPLEIGSKGQILEWNEEFPEAEPHHRHVSHLYALHPAGMITKEKTPELFEAAKKTLELRGDAGTGRSLAWKINFWARLRDGNHALELLKCQLNPVKSGGVMKFAYMSGGGTYPNMFDAHPPFQIDGNFGAVSGIGEMLMQSDGENIYILPALPDEWKNGSVKGLRARGNVTVDIEWENLKITDLKIHGDADNLNIVRCR